MVIFEADLSCARGFRFTCNSGRSACHAQMWQILSPSYVGDLEQGIPNLRMTPTDRIRQSPNSVKNVHKALLFFLLQVLFHGIHLKSLDSVDYFVFSAKKLGTQKQSSFLLIMFNQYAQILDKLGYCIFLVSPFVTRLF